MRRTFTLLTLLLLATAASWGADTSYSLTPDQASTGSNSTSYITTLTEFTYNGISWKMNQWNPSTLQVKTNQSSAASEFRFYNTSAFPGRITKVVITFSALSVSSANKLMFKGGTSEVTGTSGGTAGTWNSNTKTLTWTPSSSTNYTYFAFYQDGKAATGTNYLASSDAIVVTYEESSSSLDAPVLDLPSNYAAFSGFNVLISNEVSGATYYYTLDGTEPSATNGSNYEVDGIKRIRVTGDPGEITVKAIAIKDGQSSSVTTATYRILGNGSTGSNKYRLVTSTADLEIGKQYVIASNTNSLVMSNALINSSQYPSYANNKAAASATFSDNNEYITLTDNNGGNVAAEFTLCGVGNNYAFYNNSATNYVLIRDTRVYDNTSPVATAITINDDNATITTNYLGNDYNLVFATSPNRFTSSGTGSSGAVQLYKQIYPPTTSGVMTFVQTSTSAGTLTGAPNGSNVTATFSNTYGGNKEQITANNSMTLTISGMPSDYRITGLHLEAKNNASSGSGTVTATMNNTEIGSGTITGLGSTYQDFPVSITQTVFNGDLVITIEATQNSVFCDKFDIYYEFIEEKDYDITVVQPTGGTISATPSGPKSADANETVTLTVESTDTGYTFSNWLVTDGSNNAVSVSNNQFTMPASDVTVSAAFSKVNYNIYRSISAQNSNDQGGWLGNWNENCTLPDGANGTNYTVTSTYGAKVRFKAGNNEGYTILESNVTVKDGANNNVPLTVVSSDDSGTVFEFDMPASDVTISAYFTFYQPTIRLAGRFNGRGTSSWIENSSGPEVPYDAENNVYTTTAYFTGESSDEGEQVDFFYFRSDNSDLKANASGNCWIDNNGGPYTLGGGSNFRIRPGVYTITINQSRTSVTFTKLTPTITFSPAAGEVETGQTVTATSTLSTLVSGVKALDNGAAGDVTVQVSTDNSNWQNSVTLSTAGTQTVYGRATIGNISVTGNATFNVTAVNTSNQYELVTSADQLVAGKKYIIMNAASGSGKAMSTQANNNRNSSVSYTITDNTVTIGSDVQVITLEGSTGAWNFNVGDGYLYAAGANSNNYLRTEATVDENGNADAAITIDRTTYVAGIVFQGTASRNTMQFNNASDQQKFACYASASQSDIYLYRQKVEEVKDYTITYAEVTGGSASGVTDADAGDVITVTLTAGEGYAASGVSVTTDDPNYQTLTASGSGNSYTFTVPNDFAGTTITVTPTFATSYAITYVAEPSEGGIVTGPASAVYDATVEVTVTPKSDYRLVGQPTYTYNSITQNLTGSGPYTFNMPGYATTVTANFEKIPHGITVTSAHGEVSGLPETATSGTAITFTVTPNAGYVVTSVSGTFNNGNSSLSITDNHNGTYTFNMPSYDVAITVTYFASEDYELLTDLSDINEQDTYLIVGGGASDLGTKTHVMGQSTANDIMGAVGLTSSNYEDGIIHSTANMAIVNFLVGTGDNAGKYAIHTSEGYINSSSVRASNPSYMTIELDGEAKRAIIGSFFSFNSSSPRWKYYNTHQGANYIFKLANVNKVKRPAVTGAAGEYLGLYNFIGKDNVSLTCTTEDATIEYSLDNGTTWQSYSTPFEITTNAAGNTVEVQARASKTGMETSDVVTATFTCVKPTAPTFGTNVAGDYVNPMFVYPKSALNDRRAYSEESVTFYYDLLDETPTLDAAHLVNTSNSNGYYIYLDDDALLKVVTVINGIASDPAGGEYTFSVAAPTFSLPGGNYDGNQQTRLTTETKTQQNNVSWNTTIYYTTGNTQFAFNEATGEVTSAGWVAYDPTNNPYLDILAINGTTTIKAVTLSNYINGKEKYVASAESSQTYVLTAANLAITISPAAGTYVNAQTVTLGVKNNLGDYLIYYSLDGSEPSILYTEPFTVDHDLTVKVSATDSRTGDGGIAETEAEYKIGVQPVEYSPIPGAYFSGDDEDITVELFSVTPNAKVYYTVAEGEGNIPADPTTSSTLYNGDIPLETGKTYNFKAIAVIGNKVSAITSGTYTINAKGDGWLNVKEMNEDDNYSTAKTLLNPVQVVYMSTWHNNGTKPEFCFVRDNSGYGVVYFGGSSVTDYNSYTKFQTGDWLDGKTISGKLNVWSSSFINELGTSGGSIGSWPSARIGNNDILPEKTTNQAITEGWTYNGAYTGSDYDRYIDHEKNLFGHFVHMRKNTVTNVTGEGDGKGKHIGIITDQSGVPLNYYDGLYLFSGYNGTPDYDQAFFNDIQNNGGTLDIYAIVYFYGPNAHNSSYSNAPYEIFPIDFEWIYKPRFNKETGIYHEPQTVSLTCDSEGAQIWYKTSEMEAYEPYTGPFTVDATTTIESYSTLPSMFNDVMESLVNSITITIGTVEAPVITPASVLKTVGESVTASISCETEGAIIYYTTDGSDPKTSTTRMEYTAESDMTFTTTTTVRAIAMQDDFYSVEAESKTYTFVKSNGIVYDLVTTASELDENSVYVIVNKANHMAMSKEQESNHRDASGVKFVNEATKTQVYGNDDVAVFTLKKSGNNWLLQTYNGADVASNGYLTVGNGNLLLTTTTADANSEATIVIDDNDADVDKAYESHISFIYNSETPRYLRFWLRDLHFNAYTSEANQPVFLYKKEATPLALIEKEGVVGNDYTIADQLVVVYAKGASLWCKDQGNVSIAKTEKQDGQTDYMSHAQGLGENHEWDQSNWVELKFTAAGEEPSSNLVDHLGTYVGKAINPATVDAVLDNKLNYSMTVMNGYNLNVTDGEAFTPNVYCPANFLNKNLNLPGHEPGDFYFVNPKVQEKVIITYAVWMGNDMFVMPAKSADGKTNINDFDGAIAVSWDYNSGGNMANTLNALEVQEEEPQAYRFEAIVRRTDGSTYGPSYGPRREPGKPNQTPETGLIVYPTNLDLSNESQIVTAAADVRTVRTVASVEYYDVAGTRSSQPREGVNIVVTRYTDGTISTEKVVVK